MLSDVATSKTLITKLKAGLLAPVDIAPLVYFRVLFGVILLWEVVRYFQHGWIARYYIEPVFYFKYYGFSWINPWPGIGMYLHFIGLGLLALMIALGLFYRVASVLFFLGFTYVFLLDQTNYLNHFYLISLISFLLIFLPAHQAVSLDAGRKPKLRQSTVPSWTLWLLRFQLAVPYFYGGLAKLNADWLRGEPMRAWLADRTDFPLIGQWFTREWMVYGMSYGGLLFDLLVAPMLLFRYTRGLAVMGLVCFHLINSQLFSIGIFPWFMLLATPVFFPPGVFRAALVKLGVELGTLQTTTRQVVLCRPPQRVLTMLLVMFIGFQVLFPFRHYLYPGSANWNELGHRFAWHMKLRDKSANAQFLISAQDQHWLVRPEAYLTRRQQRKMATRPDMILQFSHFLAAQWEQAGYEQVQVQAEVSASLNGRAYQALINPYVDLAQEPRSLRTAAWVTELHQPLVSVPSR